jgi:NifU-like protein involved in Fe-S cluster formation
VPEPLGETALRLFRAPAHAGHGGPGWTTGAAREPLSGTELRWHWRVADGRIREARYEARGCPHVIAAAELAAVSLEGQPAAGPRLDIAAISRAIDAPPDKLGRLLLLEDAMCATALLVAAGGS